MRSPRRRAGTTRRSRISNTACASKTRWSTPSRPNGRFRCGIRWARCCSKRAAPSEAETVYWEDLKRNRENGFALTGLVQALRAQKKDPQAAIVDGRRAKALARADVTLPGSRFGRVPAAATASVAPAFAAKTATLANGLVLPYVEQGPATGTPVIFLHGVTDSWRSFEQMLPHLPPTMRAIAVTQRGHGDASRPDTFSTARWPATWPPSWTRSTSPLPSRGPLDGRPRRPAFCHRLPRPRARAGAARLVPTLTGHPGVRELWDMGLASMRDPIDPAFVRGFQESTVATPIPAPQMDTYVAESLKVPARVWQALFATFLADDFAGDLGRITAPALVVSGGKDSFSRRQERDALLAAIRGATASDYPELGHAMHWERPAALASDIALFVSRLPAAPMTASRH